MSPKKFLIIGPAWVGDMVMAQSLFKLLHARNPGIEIDVAAPAWTAPLTDRMPEVHENIPLPFSHGELALGQRWRLGRRLRDRRYGRAIVLPNSLKSAIVPFAAQIPRRTGYIGELRYGLLTDARKLDKKACWRTVDRFLSLGLAPGDSLPPLMPPRLQADANNTRSALQRLGLQWPGRKILGLCPGAEFGPAKRWPTRYFAEVANAKLAQGWDVWLFGSEKDQAATREIQTLTQDHCIDLAGRTSLGDAIDLLALTDAVVTNDSGLMHVAAALDRPTVALFGSSDPRHTPPLNERARSLSLALDCSPCFKRVCPLGHTRCLTDLTPKRVLDVLDA